MAHDEHLHARLRVAEKRAVDAFHACQVAQTWIEACDEPSLVLQEEYAATLAELRRAGELRSQQYRLTMRFCEECAATTAAGVVV